MLQHHQEEIVWFVEAVDGVGVMSSTTPHVYVQERFSCWRLVHKSATGRRNNSPVRPITIVNSDYVNNHL